MELRKEGLYTPLVGGSPLAQKNQNPEKQDKLKEEAGRPNGTTGIPQGNRKISPVGQSEASKAFSLDKVKENMILAQKLEKQVATHLRKTHKVKRLNENQKNIATEISQVIIANESPDKWSEVVDSYCKNPVDTNSDRVSLIREIACEHQLDFYLASILASSTKN